MAQLLLKNLRFRSKHGYFSFEREITANTFTIDVCFETDLSRAGQSDNLEHTLNYVSACQIISDIMHAPPVKLVEHLLQQMGRQLMEAFPEVSQLDISLRKHQPPMPFDIEYIEVSEQWKRAL